MSVTVTGYSWRPAQVDEEGHRTYKITFTVQHLSTDGPYTIINASGLPSPGSYWNFGTESDVWAFRLPTSTITPKVTNEPNFSSEVECTFSTKPQSPDKQRCQDNPVGNPLLEPPKLSGGGTKYSEEATIDRFGSPINNSAYEQIRGPHVEFDANRANVKVEMNVYPLPVALYTPMINCLNSLPMWGLPVRCWKMSAPKWERKFYQNCSVYFTVTYEFDSNIIIDPITNEVSSGFDRDILDEGSKVLNGHWGTNSAGDRTWVLDAINGASPDPRNPQHFIKWMDPRAQPMRGILNGGGLPAGVQVIGSPTTIVNAITNPSSPLLLTIVAQPGTPSKLYVTLDDPNRDASGYIDINGLDENGNSISETLEFTDTGFFGLYGYVTSNIYAFVSNMLLLMTSPPDPSVILKVTTNNTVYQPGNIHVERYEYANFFLLNIPATFG